MSRFIGIIGLAVVTSLAAAGCHTSAPPGDMGNQGGMGNDPMNPMYRTHQEAVCVESGHFATTCAAPQAR